MAIIDSEQDFNPDNLDNAVIGIAADMGSHDSGMHQHQKAQLLYASAGCISISLEGFQCVLPPTRAIWLPAGVRHRAMMYNVVAYRSLYFEANISSALPDKAKIINVTPLLKALIDTMSHWPWDKPRVSQHNSIALFFEILDQAEEEQLFLPLPSDKRLNAWLQRLQQSQSLPPQLSVMTQEIGASEKTIGRIFNQQTGMSYQVWRQQWRLFAAIEKLAEGKNLAQVAHELAFSSDSAFISFFKKLTGATPSHYMRSR